MAPNGWVDGLDDAADRISDELQGSSEDNFEIPSEPVLAAWVIAAIALGTLGVFMCFVCLVVACCRCCCRSESGRVLIAPQPVAPQPQVVTQIITTPYPVSPTPLQMPQPETHASGAYGVNNKPSRPADCPPAYDHDQVPLLN